MRLPNLARACVKTRISENSGDPKPLAWLKGARPRANVNEEIFERFHFASFHTVARWS